MINFIKETIKFSTTTLESSIKTFGFTGVPGLSDARAKYNSDFLGISDSPADNSPADNSPADNSPADNSTADNSPADNSPAGNSPAGNSPADNSPKGDVGEYLGTSESIWVLLHNLVLYFSPSKTVFLERGLLPYLIEGLNSTNKFLQLNCLSVIKNLLVGLDVSSRIALVESLTFVLLRRCLNEPDDVTYLSSMTSLTALVRCEAYGVLCNLTHEANRDMIEAILAGFGIIYVI